MAGWTYLILSEKGKVYLGSTSNLRGRLRGHNSPRNNGWTRGQHWHLLAVREFSTNAEALRYEYYLKKKPHQKIKWKLESVSRAKKIQQRFDYAFDPSKWLVKHSRGQKKSTQPSNTKSRLAKQPTEKQGR